MADSNVLPLAPPGPLTHEQEHTVLLPADKWSDEFALKVAVRDFQNAEAYRSQNHDWRFRVADEMYLAWQSVRYWEGTRIPRSSLGIYVVFEQVESFLPKLMQAIFGDSPWFQTTALPGASPQQARAWAEVIAWQMEQSQVPGALRVSNIREHFRRCAKSMYIYGNGIVEVGMEYSETERLRRIPQIVPKKRKTFDPASGRIIDAPTGEVERTIIEKKIKEYINRPFARNLSIKDFYIDPNCPGPVVQEARFACKRAYMTVDEVMELQGQNGFKSITKDEALSLAKNKTSANADSTKSSIEAFRMGNWSPQVDQSSDPAAKRIECIAYSTRDRSVWFLDRSKLFFNAPNEFGFIPYFNAPYADVPDRFYCLGIADVAEGEQRFQQATINSRVDELALSIHPATIKRRGVSIPAYQLRRRPGNVIELDNPKEDLIREEPMNVTAQAWQEVQASDVRVQKATGGSDLAILGTPSSGGNSANRTATGINQQASATAGRVTYSVENFEDLVVEPILNAFYVLDNLYLTSKDVVPIVGPDGQQMQFDPTLILGAPVRFTMRASARMIARSQLQSILPLILQSILNPSLLQMMQQAGSTIDVEEVMNLVKEATGYKGRFELVRKLTPEEQQKLNQPPPDQQMKMQMQQARLQAQGENQDKKSQSDESMQENEHLMELMRPIIEKALEHAGGGAIGKNARSGS